MFRSLNLFSETACPEGPTCGFRFCLFSHLPNPVRDNLPVTPATEENIGCESGASPSRVDMGINGKERSRKRRKVDKDEIPSSINADRGHTASADGAKSRAAPINSASSGQSKSPTAIISALVPSTARRTISPPPLARNDGSASSSNAPKDAKSQKSTAKATDAPESLNPRFLARPPASHAFRLTVLKKLHEEMARLHQEDAKKGDGFKELPKLSDRELVRFALDEEERVAKEQPLVYSNLIKQRIMTFKKMKLEAWRDWVRKTLGQETESAQARTERAASPTETGLGSAEELLILPRLVSAKNLGQHGFVVSPPTQSEIEKAKQGVEAAGGYEECDRCKTRFQIFPGRRQEDGLLTTGGKCSYHWGKPALPPKRRHDHSRAPVEKQYACCNEPIGSSRGCTAAEHHVIKVTDTKRLALVLQFEETPVHTEGPAPERALCLDCEMCYTVHGLELVRMTATRWPSREELVDVLVRPMGEVLDLNSRFSGVWPEDLARAQAYDGTAERRRASDNEGLRMVESPRAARALLFTYIDPKTVIIGHGLENDLNVLRIIHPTIIDTALMSEFRHPRGLPYRLGLKFLVRRHLGRDIQVDGPAAETGVDGVDGKEQDSVHNKGKRPDSDKDKAVAKGRVVHGHDSKEDARAAGDLVRWVVEQRWRAMKRKGWRFEGGQLVEIGKERKKGKGG